MIAFIFPGQGSQKVGMGKALAESFPEARAVFDEADAAFAAGVAGSPRLSSLCFEGPDDQLMLTEHTQPAILTVSVAAARVLASHGIAPDVVAGHSLGEYQQTSFPACFASTMRYRLSAGGVDTCRKPCQLVTERWPPFSVSIPAP